MDMISFIIGLLKGKKEGTGNIVLEGGDYAYTDSDGDGNIVITKED